MAGIITGIFTLLGILVGFYIGRFSDVNRKVVNQAKKVNKAMDKSFKGTRPKYFVEQPNDYMAEMKQDAEKAKQKLKEESEI